MKKLLAFPAFLGFGILSGWIVAHIYVQGYFISWKTLENPPEKPMEILSINKGVWIKSISGKIYAHPTDEAYPFQPIECSKNCWKEFEKAPPDEEFSYPVKNCRKHVPSTKKFVTSKAVCQNFGPAYILIIYGIDKNDNVSFWHHGISDTDSWAYFMYPIPAVGFVILCYILWLLVDHIRTRIKKRQQIEGN